MFGGMAVLRLDVVGIGPFTYQWRLNGTNCINQITTVAGTGVGGYSGDGGLAPRANLSSPQYGVVADRFGNLIFSDTVNARVRMVTTNGIINTIAGNGTTGNSGDGGLATNASLFRPAGLSLDALGNLFNADLNAHCIRKVDTNGIISTVAGNGLMGFLGDGNSATNARLNTPTGVAVSGQGDVFIADFYNHRIRRVGTNGVINTVAGRSSPGYSGDGGFATNATLSSPSSVTLDDNRNLLIADYGNSTVRKLGADGIITSLAGTGEGTASSDGGVATNTNLAFPQGVAMDAVGNIFVADTYSSRIREIGTNGIITTIAGRTASGFFGDGGPATNALQNHPSGITFDGFGNLFIADTGNNRIRKLTFFDHPALALNNLSGRDSGNYDVVVTSPFGSITSAVATLTVAIPPLQSAISDHNLALKFIGVPGQTYILQSTTNFMQPADWRPVYTNAADANGSWLFGATKLYENQSAYFRLTIP